MGITLINNAHTTLSADASSTDTVIYVDDIDSFPTLGVGDYFYLTLERTSGAQEIVKVTQVNASSFDVVRGQENTIPISFPIGARAELRITVQSLEDQFDDAVESHIEDTAYGVSWDGNQLIATKNALYDKIETLLPSASYTAADVLAKLLTVDGSGSGLDADLLDGMSSAAFAQLAAANVFSHTTGNTFNGRINIDPAYAVYDQFANVEASMVNFGSGSLTVAASKQLDFFRADNTFTIGSASIAAFKTINLTSSSSSHSTSNMYGALYALNNEGPGTIKALYGRAIGLGSSTGPVIGVVSATTPGASTSLSASHQVSINSTNKKVDYALWVSATNATDQVDYGLIAGTDIIVNQAFVQMAATGAGNFLNLKNATASADLFTVFPTGSLFTNGSIELGHASDTTLARSSAGNVSVEGNLLYRAGGTDVPVTDGGTGASTAASARTNLGFANGTYTPTLTNVANCAALGAYVCQYMQIGDVVTVSGKFDLDPTTGASTWTRFTMTLPVASNLASSNQLGGTTVGYAGAANGYGAVLGDATNDVAEVSCYPIDGANASWYFTFTYRVI